MSSIAAACSLPDAWHYHVWFCVQSHHVPLVLRFIGLFLSVPSGTFTKGFTAGWGWYPRPFQKTSRRKGWAMYKLYSRKLSLMIKSMYICPHSVTLA